MDDLLESTTRCPHCSAATRPDAPWCTLCHADLRPQPPTPTPSPEPEPAPVLVIPPTAAYGPPAIDPLTAPATAPDRPAPAGADPTWPCATCGATNPLAEGACGACGAGFLAGLREAEGPLLQLPGVGDLTRLSRGQRMGLAFGVVLAFVALTALLGLLLG